MTPEETTVAPLTQTGLDLMTATDLVKFVNAEYIKHLQCKPSDYSSYVFDIDDGRDGDPVQRLADPVVKLRDKKHHCYVRIIGAGREKFMYTRKIYFHEVNL